MVFPLTHALLLGLLALLLLRFRLRVSGMWAIGIGTAWLWLCATGVFADYLMGTLEDDFRPKAMPVLPRADAIVVLGGAMRGDTHWGRMGDLNQQADRLVHGVELYREKKAPFILLSGGARPEARSEAEMMEQIMRVMGIPERALIEETQSRDTHQNAVYSGVILRGKGVEKILLVTSAFHMRRSVPLFEEQGFEVIPAPTDYQRLVVEPTVARFLPSVEALSRTTYALREYVGYFVYQRRGLI